MNYGPYIRIILLHPIIASRGLGGARYGRVALPARCPARASPRGRDKSVPTDH